jgi:hypothetical protein
VTAGGTPALTPLRAEPFDLEGGGRRHSRLANDLQRETLNAEQRAGVVSEKSSDARRYGNEAFSWKLSGANYRTSFLGRERFIRHLGASTPQQAMAAEAIRKRQMPEGGTPDCVNQGARWKAPSDYHRSATGGRISKPTHCRSAVVCRFEVGDPEEAYA